MEQLLAILDPLAVLVVVTATMGMTELIKRLFKQDWQASATIIASAVVGSIIALPVGIAWYYGLVLGLGASGLITVATKMGNNGIGVQINKSDKEQS